MTRLLPIYLVTIILQIYCATQQKFEQNMSQPNKIITKIPINTHIIEDEKLIKFQFKDIYFEISSQMFLTSQKINEDDLFNKDKYQINVGDYCDKYPTSIQAKVRSQVMYQEDFEVLKYQIIENDKKNRIYILGSNSILYRYIFDRINIKLSNQFKIDPTIIKLEDGQLNSNIQFLQINNTLLIITNSHIYALNQSSIVNNLYQVQNYTSGSNIVDVGIIDDNQRLFWICQANSISIYQLNIQNFQATLIKKNSYSNFTNGTISAVAYDMYSNLLFITSADTLTIFSRLTQIPSYKIYNTDTNCNDIKLTNFTLYLTCSYNRIRFITQVLIQNKTGQIKATLNRYYDQQIVQGINGVQIFSYDRIAIKGEQLLAIIGQSVNRNILLDLVDVGKQQVYFLSYSVGLIDIFHLDDYSTFQQSNVLLINQKSLQLYTFFYEPSEIQCEFSRSQLGTSITLLVVFNTTHCPKLYKSQQQKGGALSICQIYYPHTILIGTRQYEEKTAHLILFGVLLILFAMMLLCIGCGVSFRKKANQAIQNIKKKLEKVKKSSRKRKN